MSLRRAFLIVIPIAFCVRLAFAIAFPSGGGDWATYSTVALNILRGCGVSLSSPGGEACIPHFGGNHLPGHPAFIALIWLVFEHSLAAIRVAQILLFCLALARLMSAVASYSRSVKAALAIGLVMALSPLQVAWFRLTQTEALSITITVWFLAELVGSFAERRLRAVPLGLATAAAIWLRWDGLTLCIPVAIAAFILHGPVEAIRRGAVAALIVVLPLTAWLVRNNRAGLPLMPPHLVMTPQIAPSPYGYAAWGATWISEEYQRMGWGWPLTFMEYKQLDIDAKAFDSAAERERVMALLGKLASHEGRPFPPAIDAEFAALARERTGRDPLRTYVTLPAKRALALWSNPLTSFAWPNEIPLQYQQRLDLRRNWSGMLELAREYPFRAASKAMTAGYRYLLIGGFLIVLLLSPLKRFRGHRELIWTVAAFVAARTLFLACTNSVETRFTVPAIPALELVAVLGALVWLRKFGDVQTPTGTAAQRDTGGGLPRGA